MINNHIAAESRAMRTMMTKVMMTAMTTMTAPPMKAATTTIRVISLVLSYIIYHTGEL